MKIWLEKAFVRGFEKKAKSPSTHTCTSKAGVKYSVPSLWKAAVGLPVEKVKIEKLTHLLKSRMWKDYGGGKMLALESKDPWHRKKVEKASLRYPILIHPNGWVMDGAHRMVKAVKHGTKEVSVIRFPEDPTEARVEKKAEHPEILPSDPDRPARMSRMSMLIRPSGKGKVLINRDLEEKEAPFVPYTELAERELMGIFGFSREQAHALVSRLRRKAHLKEASDERHGIQVGRR